MTLVPNLPYYGCMTTYKAYKWGDDDLIKAVANSHSYNEVILSLGLKGTSNRTRDRIRKRTQELELDTSHFLRGGFRGKNRYRTDEALFVLGIPYSTTIRRRYLKVVEYECVLCGISDWQGNPIILQVDHINGDTNDNRLDNLRLLCPNCHSQTETWSKIKSNYTSV